MLSQWQDRIAEIQSKLRTLCFKNYVRSYSVVASLLSFEKIHLQC